MKVALVHDYLVDAGGAERALLEMQRIFPEAPIYTSIYSAATTMPDFAGCDVRTTFLQALKPAKDNYKRLLPLYPIAFAGLQLRGYDLILSSSSGFAKCVRPGAGAVHVCYCYTPPRFLYRWQTYSEQEGIGRLQRVLIRALQPYLRWWDQRGAAGVDRFVANSQTVRERIRQSYGRVADVVYTPVELNGFDPSSKREDFYLIASRLLPYKRIDTAVEAFTRMGRPLVVAGDGPDLTRLRRAAGPNVSFLGRVSQATLSDLYRRCRGTVLPGEEDLGLTPLEANAAGSPVIALGRGGARETVIPRVTGVHYQEPASGALARAVEDFERIDFDSTAIRRHAERFSREHFRRGLLASIEAALQGRTDGV